MQTTDSEPIARQLQVLIVSNHWGARKASPSAGIFVDRQIASLERLGVTINTFDLGLNYSPTRILKKWLELRRLLRRLNPDLVHGRYGTIVGLLTTFSSRPAVVSFCGGDLLLGASVSLTRQCIGFMLSNLAALRATRLICVSEELRQALWWRKSKATVIPDGVDIDFFSPGSQELARQELGWKHGNPAVLLNVRNDPKAKGLDLAKAAIEMVRTRIPDVDLCIIENVEPSRMPLYYRAADALICLSQSEGSPNVVKEALACNLPVISTPVGDVRERLAGVQPSVVVERNVRAIAEGLLKILLERKRSNGRERVANLCLENTAQNVLKVYRAAVGQGLDAAHEVRMASVKATTIVPIAEGNMLQEVADLHLEAFAGYLNALLGYGYAKAFIRWFINGDRTIAIALIDGDKKILGYVLGAPAGYAGRLNRDLFLEVAIRTIMRPWLFLNPRFWGVLLVRAKNLMGLQSPARPVFDLPEPSMSLVAIGVAATQRKSGVGQRLIKAFETKAKELQIHSLVLSAYANRPGVRRFYERCGWQLEDVRGSKAGIVRYSKILEPLELKPTSCDSSEVSSTLYGSGGTNK